MFERGAGNLYVVAVYTPSHFDEPDRSVALELVRSSGFGHLVRHTGDGLLSTPLPIVVDDELGSVRAHVARANPIWRAGEGPGLLIVALADAYISPSWYPSKAEHGKVVPTWNYEVVHLHGELIVHDDSSWVGDQIGALTDHNEADLPSPWAVTDAPPDFIAKQQRAIVGLELVVERVEAKRKLSQNRTKQDHDGVVAGLGTRTNVSGPGSIAGAMAGLRQPER